ncbi:MAG: choice-of-anchor Q domain-containing protein [Kiritimatiellia bacterium]
MAAVVPMFYRVVMNPDFIHVATNGDDSTGLGTSNAPFATIQKGIDTAFDRDTVFVHSGTYTGDGNRDLNMSGKNIDIISQSGPLNTIIDCGNTNRAITFAGGETNMLISGFSIRNGARFLGTGVGGVIQADNFSTPVFQNCIIVSNNTHHHTEGGEIAKVAEGHIAHFAISRAIFYNCVFAHNTVEGTSYSASGPTYPSVVYGADLFNCTLANNTVGAYGISTGRVCQVGTVLDGIVWANSAHELFYDISATYCDLQSAWIGDGNISVDPLFVSPATADFSLQAGSPCINTGTNMSWMIDSKDIIGNDRITGGIVDLGAYEHQ